jgi:hypothetical protein
MTWLEQRQPGCGAVLLQDYPAGEVVHVTCQRYDRAGRYHLAGLVERFGPATGLPDVLEALAACPLGAPAACTTGCSTAPVGQGRL